MVNLEVFGEGKLSTAYNVNSDRFDFVRPLILGNNRTLIGLNTVSEEELLGCS